MTIKKLLMAFILTVFCISVSAQITSAKITFERKTNLYKELKGNVKLFKRRI
jgi:hypothetical protein